MNQSRSGVNQQQIAWRREKVLASLRTAVEKREGTLDKEATSHDDLFDAFRMSLIFWH